MSHRGRRDRFFGLFIFVVVAPIIAVVILYFRLDPFLRLLTIDIRFVLTAAGHGGIWGPTSEKRRITPC